MRAVVQRVSEASVTVDGQVVGSIDEPGLLVLVGVTHDDSPAHAERLAAKLWGLRILPAVPRPEAGAENADTAGNRPPAEDTVPARSSEVSCSDVAAPLLVVSQFTLYADTRKGRRPSWSAAAPGPVAEPLVEHVVTALRKLGARVETGVFGAQMRVSLVNNGPVTLIVEV